MRASSQKPTTHAKPRFQAPMISCDLCSSPMAFPEHLIGKPLILGLLTCSQCVEDNLATRQMECQP